MLDSTPGARVIYDVGVSSLAQDPGAPTSSATLRPTSRGAALAAVILFIIGMAAAISVDVVRDAYDIKGDESTYVAMTLSLAHDGDLSYQRRDLERFWGLYSMRVICFTVGRNELLNSNKSGFETKIGDISTGKSDENRG